MPIRILDAIRIRDEMQVIIKMIIPSKNILQTMSFAVWIRFQYQEWTMVISLSCLYWVNIHTPPFHNLEEVHDCLRQLFDGLSFMHENNVAHCDISGANIMMDVRPLYDEPFHPVHRTLSPDIKRQVFPRYRRSEKDTKYYYIDLGYAKWFQDPDTPRMISGGAAREMAPEQLQNRLYNPFQADAYQLGMTIHRDLIQEIDGLNFLQPMITQLTHSNPSARPSLTRVQESVNTAFLGLSGLRYRWPLVPREAGLRARGIYFIWGIMLELKYWLERVFGIYSRARK
ncbi:hypothetical protein OPQ81_011113 [Rhizoctonia solani]|nr:hypothetical protein OPQ81_011113 [Rhizoctonia solani]